MFLYAIKHTQYFVVKLKLYPRVELNVVTYLNIIPSTEYSNACAYDEYVAEMVSIL